MSSGKCKESQAGLGAGGQRSRTPRGVAERQVGRAPGGNHFGLFLATETPSGKRLSPGRIQDLGRGPWRPRGGRCLLRQPRGGYKFSNRAPPQPGDLPQAARDLSGADRLIKCRVSPRGPPPACRSGRARTSWRRVGAASGPQAQPPRAGRRVDAAEAASAGGD